MFILAEGEVIVAVGRALLLVTVMVLVSVLDALLPSVAVKLTGYVPASEKVMAPGVCSVESGAAPPKDQVKVMSPDPPVTEPAKCMDWPVDMLMSASGEMMDATGVESGLVTVMDLVAVLDSFSESVAVRVTE